MLTIDMIKTGENIKALRVSKGLSVKDIQKRFGFASGYAIYKWQNGTSLPSLDNLVILADILGVSMDSLIITKRAA